jgi:hypothetical protein
VLGKLLIILLVVGATASALLVNRQKRIETFHEMSQIHRRLHNHECTLWKLRVQIAARCRPSQVRLLVDRLGGEWIPIPAPGNPVMQPPNDVRLASNAKPEAKRPATAKNTSTSRSSNGSRKPASGSRSSTNRVRPG